MATTLFRPRSWSVAHLLLLAGIAWGAFGLQYTLMGRFRTAALDGALTLICCGLAVVAKGRPNENGVVHAGLAANLAGLGLAAVWSGGGASLAQWYLLLIPLFASARLSTTGSLAWGLLTMAAFATIRVVPGPVEFIPEDWERWSGAMMLVGLIVAYATAATHSRAALVANLTQRNSELNRMMKLQLERTEELADARDRAQANELVKAAFLARMSHELRTPMSALVGLLELLVGTLSQSQESALAVTARASATRFMRLTDDLLDLTQLDPGKAGRVFDPVETACRAAEALQDPSAFRLRQQPDLAARFFGNPRHITAVVSRLLARVESHTQAGRAISVELRQNDGLLQVEIVGSAQRVEDLHTQVPGSMVEDGLGFELLARSVEEGGGSLREGGQGAAATANFQARATSQSPSQSEAVVLVKMSDPALQSTVEMCVVAAGMRVADADYNRLVADADPAADVVIGGALGVPYPPRPAAIRAALIGGAAPKEVLVADDDAVARTIAVEMLERLGHKTRSAKDGAEALELLTEWKPDVVLLDIHMPNTDGVQLTRSLRTTFPKVALPIFAVTASTHPTVRLEALRAGVTDVLYKPVSLEILRVAIGDAARAAPPPEPPRSNDALERLRILCAKKPGAFQSLIDRHIEAAQTQLGVLRDSGSDLEDQIRAVHSLRGSTATFGALQLSQLCGTIEDRLRGGQYDDVRPAFDELASLWSANEKRLLAAVRTAE